MHSVKEFDIIDNEIINNIFTIVNDDKSEFQKSLLFSTETKTKFIDENERTSKFKLLKDKPLFDYFDQLVEKINQVDPQYNYSVVHNDITYIQYDKGGFQKTF